MTVHTTVRVSYDDIQKAVARVILRWHGDGVRSVHGVPRGGLVPAALVATGLGVPLVTREQIDRSTLIVDDLVDSGHTAESFDGIGIGFDALYRKPTSPAVAPDAELVDGWLVLPWEDDEQDGPERNVQRLLEFIGEDPLRPGLVDTPGRVVRAMAEMTEGYNVDVEALLSRTFDDRCDEMVVVRGIEFTSLCEHHLLPFNGTATVGYLPGDQVVGLSKLARLVDAYARRLQVQERMTTQIAAAVEQHLAPLGVGVVVVARHSCMGCRGVRKPGAEMVTSAMLGAFRDKPEARAEFLGLAG